VRELEEVSGGEVVLAFGCGAAPRNEDEEGLYDTAVSLLATLIHEFLGAGRGVRVVLPGSGAFALAPGEGDALLAVESRLAVIEGACGWPEHVIDGRIRSIPLVLLVHPGNAPLPPLPPAAVALDASACAGDFHCGERTLTRSAA
jgi:hypothetical protein